MWASDEGPEPVTEFFEVTTADALAQRLPAAAAGQAATVPLACLWKGWALGAHV